MAKQRKNESELSAAPGGVEQDERYLVPALTRGLNILQELSGERRSMTLTQVATVLGVTRSSAYRLLFTLGHLGFVDFHSATKTYSLGSQVLRLGYGYLASRDLVEVAMPHLVRLRDRTGWSAHLGELHGRDVVYLARVATRRSIASNVHIGTRLPARATTMGRILLSELPEEDIRELYRDEPISAGAGEMPAAWASFLDQLAADRDNGVVVQSAGFEPGVASVAAPVRDMTGKIVAAINVSAVALLTSDPELQGPLKDEVIAVADAISRDLGHQTTPVRNGNDLPSAHQSAS